MAADESGGVTDLLRRVESGDQAAVTDLVRSVENRLRALAEAQLKGGRGWISASDVVQEATTKVVVRLIRGDEELKGTEHFFAVMAKTMSRIVIDHNRRSKAMKRPDSLTRVPLDDLVDVVTAGRDETEAPDERLEKCLERLRKYKPRAYGAVYLHQFEGMSVREAARELEVSESTIEKDLRYARAYLRDCVETTSS